MSKVLEEKLEKRSPKEQKLWALRHTAEHVLHAALQNLYLELKKAMGPATEDGFYFDFDLDQKISEEDFPHIEKEMKRLIDLDLPIVQEFVSVKEAREIFKDNPYKLEWVEEIEKRREKVSLFKMGSEDVDLCSGPHTFSTGNIKAFKLLSVAGAYWHGDEKNKMLTRIYGTCFPTQKELDDYLKTQKSAEESDHRKIGKDLDLFVFSDLVGKGLPLLTERGSAIRRELERFTVDEEIKRGYKHVITPVLSKTDLFRRSGHYPYYKDTMYPPMIIDEEELILRPMTCPHHFMYYQSRPRSYKDLPFMIAEVSPQFRYEKSGELTGLMRVRTFCLADGHIIAKKDQAKDVIKGALDLIDYMNKTLGLKKGQDYRYRLSLGNRKDTEKYYKDDKAWNFAEQILREVLIETKSPYFETEGEAAFYGPKIDVQIKKISGVEETAFTVQYDFVMPKRFELQYIDEEGKKAEPIVIHRSSIGAIERTMAFLIEKYKGNFPTWLTPVQVKVLPITDRNLNYANNISDKLKEENIRVEVDNRNETLQAKIRDAQLEKVAYMLIVGDREEKESKITVRKRNGTNLGAKNFEEFARDIKKEIKEKSIT